jgi:DNA repair protein RadA/Sms
MRRKPLSTGLRQLDRLLGRPHGLHLPAAADGSTMVVAIAGDPGTGKSTLLLKAASTLSEHGVVLYVTGEETIDTLESRARRIGVDTSVVLRDGLDLAQVDQEVEKLDPLVLIIDSVHALRIWDGVVEQRPVVSAVSVCRYAAKVSETRKIPVLMAAHTMPRGTIPNYSAMAPMLDVVLKLTALPGDALRRLQVVEGVSRHGRTVADGMFEMRVDGLHDWPRRAA